MSRFFLNCMYVEGMAHIWHRWLVIDPGSREIYDSQNWGYCITLPVGMVRTGLLLWSLVPNQTLLQTCFFSTRLDNSKI